MAGVSLLGWTNYVKAATITATSQATNLPASNLASDNGSPSSGWQTVSGVLTPVMNIVPFNAAQSWDAIGLFRTNLTSNAAVTFALWRTSGTLVWSQTLAGPVATYGQVVAVVPTTTTADYVQVTISDPGNPDGFINVPLVFCGPAWRPLGSAGLESTVGRDTTLQEVTTRGGSEFPTLYYQRRRWNVVFDAMREAETWTNADKLNLYAASGSNCLFVPDLNSGYMQQEAIFGRLKPAADISYPYGGTDRRRWTAVVTERM